MSDITNMNMSDFEKLMYKISEKISFYENYNGENSSYSLTLSNGDRINLKFPSFSIPHLLGVKSEGLKKIFGKKIDGNIYKQLKYACDNYYTIYSECISGKRTPITDVFSKHAPCKVEAFCENIKVNIYNTDFICKYDRDKAHMLGKEALPYDYILCKHNSDNEFFMLGLVEDQSYVSLDGRRNKCYVPMSNQYFQSREEAISKFSDLLTYQSLSYVTALYVSGWRGFTMQSNTKYKHTDYLQKLAAEINCNVDVTGDYRFCLNKHQENLDNGMLLTDNFAQIIAQAMHEKKIITPDLLGLEDFSLINVSLVKIINAYNDTLVIESLATQGGEAYSTYTELCSENEQLSSDNEELRTKNEDLTSTIVELKQRNEILLDENCEYKTTLDVLDDAIKCLKKKI